MGYVATENVTPGYPKQGHRASRRKRGWVSGEGAGAERSPANHGYFDCESSARKGVSVTGRSLTQLQQVRGLGGRIVGFGPNRFERGGAPLGLCLQKCCTNAT